MIDWQNKTLKHPFWNVWISIIASFWAQNKTVVWEATEAAFFFPKRKPSEKNTELNIHVLIKSKTDYFGAFIKNKNKLLTNDSSYFLFTDGFVTLPEKSQKHFFLVSSFLTISSKFFYKFNKKNHLFSMFSLVPQRAILDQESKYTVSKKVSTKTFFQWYLLDWSNNASKMENLFFCSMKTRNWKKRLDLKL